MSRRTLGVLAAILAVLLVALRWPASDSKGAPSDDRPLLPLDDLTQVNAIALADGSDELRVRRGADGTWTGAEGPLPAEKRRFLDGLLTSLTRTPRGRLIESRGEPAAFGLGDRSVRIVVETPDGDRDLRFGDVTPFGDSVYVRDANDRDGVLFLAPRGLRAAVSRAAGGDGFTES